MGRRLTENYEFKEGATFKIRQFTVGKDWTWFNNEHEHEYYEILIGLEGKLQNIVNGERYVMTEGTISLMCPGDIHYHDRLPDQSYATMCNFTFRESFFDSAAAFLGLSDETARGGFYRASANEWSATLSKVEFLTSEEGGRDAFIAGLAAKGLLVEVIIGTLRGRETRDPAPAWLRNVLDKFREADDPRFDLSRLIALSGKSQEHLTRCTRKYCGETPTNLLNRARARRAAEMLRDGKLKIRDILYEAGFESQPHFGKCFRKFYGMSPSEYARLFMPK